MAGAFAPVHPEFRVLAEGRDHDVEAAISIQIAKSTTTVARRSGGGRTCLGGECLPLAVRTGIAKDGVQLLDIHARLGDGLDVAPRDEQVLPAIVVEVEETRSVPGHVATELAHASRIGDFLEALAAFVAIDGEGLVVEGRENNVREAIVVVIAEIESHAGDEFAAFYQGDALCESNFFESGSGVVEQEVIRGVVGDEEIRPSIEIVVGDAYAHPLANQVAKPPFLGYIFKRAIATIQEQLVRLALVKLRAAVIVGSGRSAEMFGFRVPLQVVHDEKIEQAIIVHIDPGGRRRPERTVFGIPELMEACFLRHIGERAVAIVVVQGVAVDACHENIRKAVVVVIADGHAHVVSGAGETRFLRDIGENAFSVIPEQPVRELGRIFLERFNVGAVGKKNVRTTVLVVIKNGNAAGHGRRCVREFRRFIRLHPKGKRLERETDSGCIGTCRPDSACRQETRGGGTAEKGEQFASTDDFQGAIGGRGTFGQV